jgi:type VI secretion system protein ImpJ
MKAPRRPVWTEGMLLSPQHLQALDRYHETLLAVRVGAVAPYDWGVAAMGFDAAALAAGQVRLTEFAGVLPEGLVVGFEAGDPEAPPPRPFGEHFPPTARSLDVLLAVAREREGMPSFADEDKASRVRFAVTSRPLEDASAPGTPVAVALGRPNAVLLFGDEAREDFEVLKIAELTRNAAGQVVLADAYLPPSLRISALPWLLAQVRDLQSRLLAKQRDLVAGGGRAGGEVSGVELMRMLQLLVLSEHAPSLANLVDSGQASPLEAWRQLAALAGQLAALARDPDPAAVPGFAFHDLRATFEPLVARLAGLLGGLAAAQFVAIPLEARAGGLHLGRFPDEALLRAQLFLAVKSELAEQQVADVVPRLCKIASTSEIQGLVQAATPGLALKWLSRPPPQLAPKAGVAYFSIATGDRYWQGIAAAKAIAIYLPPPFDPGRTKVELLAIPAGVAGAPSGGTSPAVQAPEIKRY